MYLVICLYLRGLCKKGLRKNPLDFSVGPYKGADPEIVITWERYSMSSTVCQSTFRMKQYCEIIDLIFKYMMEVLCQ